MVGGDSHVTERTALLSATSNSSVGSAGMTTTTTTTTMMMTTSQERALNNNGNTKSKVDGDYNDDTLLSNHNDEKRKNFVLKFWQGPLLLPSTLITILFLLPTLVITSLFTYNITGRTWPATPLALHQFVVCFCYYCCWRNYESLSNPSNISTSRTTTTTTTTTTTNRYWYQSKAVLIMTTILSLLDIFLCGQVYPDIVLKQFRYSFVDVDGTIIVEWQDQYRTLQITVFGFNLVSYFRIVIGMICWLSRLHTYGNTSDDDNDADSTFPFYQTNSYLLLVGTFLKKASRCLQQNVFYKTIWNGLERVTWWMIRPFVKIRHTDQSIQYSSLLMSTIRFIFFLFSIISFLWQSYCICSCVSHFTDWNLWFQNGPFLTSSNEDYMDGCCNDMDTTECSLPFPSFHHMVPDDTSRTGWRVRLEGLPIMRGGINIDTSFLNSLDGFSTMAPILFYMEGMLESHQAELHGAKVRRYPNLVQTDLSESTTRRSVTLLLDVTKQELVPHTAEVDSLDPHKPLIMLVPYKVLDRASHYAVAVINATDEWGDLLPPTPGMKSIIDEMTINNTIDDMTADDTSSSSSSSSCSSNGRDPNRTERFATTVLPSLVKAAPWLDIIGKNKNDTPAGRRRPVYDSLQMLFDFVTASDDMLIPIKSIRDGTLHKIMNEWKGQHEVETIKVINRSCGTKRRKDRLTLAARTIHASIRVPWWLTDPQSRYGILSSPLNSSDNSDSSHSDDGIASIATTDVEGIVKFVLHIPCSLKAAALQTQQTKSKSHVNGTTTTKTTKTTAIADKWEHSKPLRAILDYGHGLFYSRQESHFRSVLRLAEDQGYVVIATDWRGLSSFDLPVILKAFLSHPSNIQATRDNIIQGYANKITLQHFIKEQLWNETDWLQFNSTNENDDGGGDSDNDNDNTNRTIRKKGNKTSASSVYSVPLLNSLQPIFAYYGSSQGGILGAGYTTLIGSTNLIDRGVLGVPGTSLAVIMSHSKTFRPYDALLLRCFYNNRHVRIIISIFQLALDPVEASGLLAGRMKNGKGDDASHPPILLQSGLGDATMPRIATEVLARTYNANVLPNNPRKDIVGISTITPASATNIVRTATATRRQGGMMVSTRNDTMDVLGSTVTWSEILFEKEYQCMPIDNIFWKGTKVHNCVSQDCAFIAQIAAFINTGEVIDPCIKDRCHRTNMSCYVGWGDITTRPENWTCDYTDYF